MVEALQTFGDLLRAYRVRSGLTQEELAEKAGLSANAVSALERGLHRHPRQYTVQVLAGVLELDVPERALLEQLRRRPGPAFDEEIDLAPDGSEPGPDLSEPAERPHNLPSYPSPLVGREREVSDLRDRLLRPNVRLLTITGPGGIGKTRLAVHLGWELRPYFENGVFFVSLSNVDDPSLVGLTIARALGIPEEAGRTALESLKVHLRSQVMLLILDNFEQVVNGAPNVSELLMACPWIKILTTSREVLRLQGENEYPVPSLRFPLRSDPHSLPRLTQYEAVALFIQAAQAVKPNFVVTNENAPAVAEICHLVDGLPLAIELVASRLRVLSVKELLSWLSAGTRNVDGGARDLPDRQRTLWKTISWSYDLLSPEQQSVFRRLAAFVGGCTLAAAEAVANTPGDLDVDFFGGVASLVEKNLLVREESGDGDSRFRMLTVIRQFGLDRLSASSEADLIGRQHARYYLQLAEQAEPYLRGREADMWLNRLEQEHDNLREALRYFAAKQDVDYGFRLVGALQWYWWERGHNREGQDWFARFLSIPGAEARTAARAKALAGAGYLASARGDQLPALLAIEESLAIFRELNLSHGIAWSLAYLAIAHFRRGDLVQSQSTAETSLKMFRELADPGGMAAALCCLGMATAANGDVQGVPTLEEALALARQIGDRDNVIRALGNLGNFALQRPDDLATARRHFTEMLRVAMNLRQTFHIAYGMEWLAQVAAREGDVERAIRLAEVGAQLRNMSGTTAAPLFRASFESGIGRAIAGLTVETIARLRAEGQAMTLDEAATYALQGVV